MPDTSKDDVVGIRHRNEADVGQRPPPCDALAVVLHWIPSLESSVASSLAHAEMLAVCLDQPEPLAAACEIHQHAKYLMAALGNLRDLSLLEMGKITLAPAPCSPREIAEEVASRMHEQARGKGVPIEVEHEESSPGRFATDPDRLRQILTILVENALALTEVGLVRLVSRQTAAKEKPPELQVEVVDTGMGLSQRQTAALFDPLGEVHATLGRRIGGTTLSLPVAQRLAGLLGGDLTAESTLGRGTRFVLSLPPLVACG
jgi:signal transduction histidine kinase